MNMKKITIINNARLSDLKADYITTILKQRAGKIDFSNTESLNLALIYITGGKSRQFFRLYDLKINSINDLVHLILYHVNSFDQNKKHDQIKLGYSIN